MDILKGAIFVFVLAYTYAIAIAIERREIATAWRIYRQFAFVGTVGNVALALLSH